MKSLTKIRFSSYKRFAGAEEIELKPVTILVGKNSSGKSSITKLFPMFRRSLLESAGRNVISYKNDGVELGVNFSSLTHNGSSVELGFGVSFGDNTSIDIELLMDSKSSEIVVNRYTLKKDVDEWSLKYDKQTNSYKCLQTGKDYLNEFRGMVLPDLFADCDVDAQTRQCIDYVGPLRVKPDRTIYSATSSLDYVGATGENAYGLFVGDTELQNKVSSWFENCFGGCKIQVKPTSDMGYQIVLNKPDQGKYDVNIVDEGMGMGQVFPIVVRCLKKIENSIVVVEQPELHLHPAAHADLAKLFAISSKENKHTYVVETHSENILLGLREAIVDKAVDFSAEDAVIYFVDEDEQGSYLKKITIDEKGVLSDWPKGVFNESYELLRSIMKKASEK